MMAFGKRHGVKYLLYEGLLKLPKEHQPPKDLLLKWYIDCQTAEKRYEIYLEVIEGLTSLMRQNEIPLMVLKGYTLARLYPMPPRRDRGDIDVYLFGKHLEAEELIDKGGYGELMLPMQYTNHTEFMFGGVMVENHMTFVSSKDSLTPKIKEFYDRIERQITESIERREVEELRLGQETIYQLSPNAYAMFFIGHTLRHASLERTVVRHYCDWVAFFSCNRDRFDLETLRRQIEECGLCEYVANVEAFCRAKLGFEPIFNFDHKIHKGLLSIEAILLRYQNRERKYNYLGFLAKIINMFKKLYAYQQYHFAYIGSTSYFDYFVPRLIARVKRVFGLGN